ncbi:MAG: hypothetical protein A2W00_01410 [Candidatus Eisenbacteria bacterium RBG_16_71_46]|nr:MAG: hypothetical protein A2W00_01410 [Candidatus Eisenbacteria bacterium RBG_16_71_46]
MRSALSTLEVARPRTLAQALEALHESLAGERCVPIAGGTDLYVSLNDGSHTGRRFLDLWGLDELRGIRVSRGGLRLGALATFREIRHHPVVASRLPALAEAASWVGAWQIQNRATLAGNIANASPAGDSLPALLAYDATVHLRSVGGARDVTFERFYRGYRDPAMEPDELITAVSVPYPPAGARAFFRKVGTRRAQSISKVVFAGLLHVGRGGRVDHARFAFGSVAPVTLRARRAEEAVLGAPASRAAAARALAALAGDISPIDDIRSDRDYRITVAGNVLEQFLRTADARFARA